MQEQQYGGFFLFAKAVLGVNTGHGLPWGGDGGTLDRNL